MNEQLTTYTVKSKQAGFIWVFKYHLNGKLAIFELLDSELTEKQEDWLNGRFHFQEKHLMVWQQKLKQNFEIVKATPVLDFENLWNLYGNKVSKFDAQRTFKKLSDADKIKCFLSIPGYKKYVAKKGIGTAHLATFISRQYYNDDWSKA